MTARSACRTGARRGAVILSAGLAVLAVSAGIAQAHVRVFSQEPAVRGAGDVALTFRVPTEENSNTIKLQVSIPTDTPLLSVDTQPKAGWSVAVVNTKLAKPLQTDDGPVTDVVSQITWTATAGGVPPGSYDDFNISVGVLPDAASVAFPAIQTYANGDVVRWIEPTPANGTEPDHPVPRLDLALAGSTTFATAAPATGATVSAAPPGTADGSDGTARGLGIAGLVVGVLGLIVGGTAIARARTRRNS